jgi:hypothetical protein
LKNQNLELQSSLEMTQNYMLSKNGDVFQNIIKETCLELKHKIIESIDHDISNSDMDIVKNSDSLAEK